MNYLAFQPAFDVLHTEFRFLRLRRMIGSDASWHFDKLRIIDFYLVFFFRLTEVRLLPKHRALKKLALEYSRKHYEMQPDDHLLFSRMEVSQKAAITSLVSFGYFDNQQFEHELLVSTRLTEPDRLNKRIEEINANEERLIKALGEIATYETLGPDGLKARSGLIEHRYDKV